MEIWPIVRGILVGLGIAYAIIIGYCVLFPDR